MASLYDLSIEFLQVAQALEELDLDQETIEDTLESFQGSIEEKAENIIKFAKNLEALSEARKAEAKRLNELAAKDTKKAERLLNYLDESLKMIGKKKLTAGIFEVGYRKGVEVVKVDESRLPLFVERPDLYIPVEPKPIGKPELKKMLKEGLEIPGVTLERNPDKLTIK
jgi:vacuolar-type H+-ATPase subunit I/STV1